MSETDNSRTDAEINALINSIVGAGIISPLQVDDNTNSVKLPNGLIVKTGIYVFNTTGTEDITFPEAFPHKCFNVQVTQYSRTAWSVNISAGSYTNAKFNCDSYTACAVSWRAIGW